MFFYLLQNVGSLEIWPYLWNTLICIFLELSGWKMSKNVQADVQKMQWATDNFEEQNYTAFRHALLKMYRILRKYLYWKRGCIYILKMMT